MQTIETTATRTISSPLGTLRLQATERGLRAIDWSAPRHPTIPADAIEDPHAPAEARRHLDRTVDELTEYFAGERTEFDIDLDPSGTEFQVAVWSALKDIPFGETVSYGDIARAIDRPTAFRAVGGAIGRNPLSIVVPCHRVVGTDGSLTGFGGGLDTKRWLLAHEQGDSNA